MRSGHETSVPTAGSAARKTVVKYAYQNRTGSDPTTEPLLSFYISMVLGYTCTADDILGSERRSLTVIPVSPAALTILNIIKMTP
jgi:hypothetical protein